MCKVLCCVKSIYNLALEEMLIIRVRCVALLKTILYNSHHLIDKGENECLEYIKVF